MSTLSERIDKLSESATIAMARRSREMKEEGHDIISLSLGEPDFNTPDVIKEAAKKAIDENYTKYMPVNGYPELRQAISRKFKRDNDLDYSPDDIVVSTGAKQSIANAVLSMVNPGDEVIIPIPYWVTYKEIIKMAEGVPVTIPTTVDQNFKITPEQLDDAISENTKLILFSTPCNPSGSTYSREELKGLANVITRYDNLYVISDEIYELINFRGTHESMANIHGMKDRTITINGVSKGFAMTGWRIGYLGAPTEIAKACTKLQGQFTSGACGISQKAAEAAVSADPDLTKYMRIAFIQRRDQVLGRLSKMKGMNVNHPEGAFYIFPDVSELFGKKGRESVIRNATDLSMYLLEVAHVATVTGEAFGDPNCLRISYAASEQDLHEAMDRMEKALNELN